MPTRRAITAGLSAATASLLSACGTIIDPDRVHQEDRGNLDPVVIILDGIGLLFFLIPGVVAFAVDLTTGAIFLPEGNEVGDEERTIFDGVSMHTPRSGGKLNQRDIEQVVSRHAGVDIDLARDDVRVAQLDHLDQFWVAHARLSGHAMLAAR